MLKVSHQGDDSFHNFKCGEIFCITAAVFNVSCCLCGSKMHLEQFSSHFQIQHLTLAEESINLEEVIEKKRKVQLANDSRILEHIPIKEEEPADDPIKQEEVLLEWPKKSTNSRAEECTIVEDTEKDEDNKSLEELVSLTKAKQEKLKLKEDPRNQTVVPRKHFTRNAKKTREFVEEENIDVALETKEHDGEIIVTPLVVEILGKDETGYNDIEDDVEYNDVDGDGEEKQWSTDEKYSGSDSDTDKDFTDDLPFPCLICKRSYRSKHSLQKHNYSVHNPNKPVKKRKDSKPQHKCEECNEVFRSARDLRGHKWKHTGIFCDICGKVFTQTGNMMRHKIRHTGIKDFKCKECNKDFFTAKELKSHMICHTGVMPVICEICGKRCRDRGVLTAHMRRHTGERPAKCDVCGKCFFSFHDLNVHAVTHSSERPFKCEICGSTFQRKKALRVHKLIHSKDRKHVCRICGKGFAQSGGLNSHMRTHDAAMEKTNKTSSIETSSALHIPTVTSMNSIEGTPQTENDVVGGSRELEEHLISEYMV